MREIRNYNVYIRMTLASECLRFEVNKVVREIRNCDVYVRGDVCVQNFDDLKVIGTVWTSVACNQELRYL